MVKKLLSKDTSNAKLAKTHDKFGRDWNTFILYLAPATVASAVSLCPASTPECRAGCLFYAGQAQVFKNINLARIAKTRYFVEHRDAFLALLRKELTNALKLSTKQGKQLAVRLNGTSDIDWVALGIIAEFPAIQFYDYTKLPTRATKWARGEMPANYHLTFSRSETNDTVSRRVLAMGGNVATVVSADVHKAIDWSDSRVLDGDLHDARFLDGKASHGVLVVLKAKGKARNTESDSGFVLNSEGFNSLLSSISTLTAAA
jgi:hypothetical protein